MTSDDTTDPMRALRQAVRATAARADVHVEIQRIYGELAAAIERRRPICVVSGRCCRFEDYGHRLYVTTAELASFMRGYEQGGRSPAIEEAVRAWDGTGCPFQVAKLCGVHALRPFGCRVFFCDETATQWQNEAYEAFHGQLKRLHEELGVPYFYLEWRQALRALVPGLGEGAGR